MQFQMLGFSSVTCYCTFPYLNIFINNRLLRENLLIESKFSRKRDKWNEHSVCRDYI